MPSNTTSEAAVDPVATLDHLMRWLAVSGGECMLGLAAGLLAARSMRRHHLHWSWAALALAVVALDHPALGHWWGAAAVAAAAASMRGRRWHREDLEAGNDLRELASRRVRPVDVLRRALAARRIEPAGLLARRLEPAGLTRRLEPAGLAAHALRGAGRLLVHRRARDGQLRLGLDESHRAVSIPFAPGGGSHTLVVGATGSGKTVTQSLLAVGAIERGMGAVIVDPKGDESMRACARQAARDAGRAYLEWTPEGPSAYNPYAHGGASEIADKALAGERFTEPHYLRQAQRYLGHAVRAMRTGAVEVSLRTIVEQLDPAKLEQLARTLPPQQAEDTFAYLDSLSSRQLSDLAGARDRLAILAESDVGRWLDPDTRDACSFDLGTAVRQHAVVYFGLHSDSHPLLSEMLGAAIVQDLQTVVASLQGHRQPTLVVLDEFSALAAEHVVRLFGRARSAGVSLLLGTQELSDLRLPGRERLLEQVLGNLSVLIAHRQVVPQSAELVSRIAGSRGAWRVTRHADGSATRTRTREPVLEPDRVMGLGRGWAATLVLGDARSARVTRVDAARRTRLIGGARNAPTPTPTPEGESR
ncbi:MAG TPA: TraM recognition domain-containing protein [Solirubrobacteraceae bacterium]|nr:TraM recognition domain-containing protein [Solirubrobacteraceae bacterium]